MTYQFNTEHAKKYGVDEAIIIYNFLFWIRKNKANNTHEHEGRTWTYNSYEALAEIFDFWSKRQVRTRIQSLIDQDVLIKGNFNKNNYDQTTWYAFKDVNSILQDSNFQLTELSNEDDTSDRPIPDNNPNKENTDNKYCYGDSEKWDTEQPIDYVSFVDAFNELYDRQLRSTDKKRESIRSRLRTFTGKEIKQAWENRLKDDWLNGEGSEYMGNWKAAMRNDEKIDNYLNAENNSDDSHLFDNNKMRKINAGH